MLVQFTVENYLSFGEVITLNMTAVKNDLTHPRHRTLLNSKSGESVVRGAALYGANGAGKSNLVEALKFVKMFVTDTPLKDSQQIPVRPFKLGPNRDAPSRFTVLFVTPENIRYQYGFAATPYRITEEWLVMTGRSGHDALCFGRTTDDEGKTEVKFGAAFRQMVASQKTLRRGTLSFVADGTKSNQLFLAKAHEQEVEALTPVMDWFNRVLTIAPRNTAYAPLIQEWQNGSEISRLLNRLLYAAKTGVNGVHLNVEPFDPDKHLKDTPINARKQVLQMMQETCDRSTKADTVDFTLLDIYVVHNCKTGERMAHYLKTYHNANDGTSVEFGVNEESDGTKRLLNLVVMLQMMSQPEGKVFVVDEMERKLHTQAARLLVQAALDNPKATRSQLIFTTHDTHLLDQELMRRDEIWFLEKDSKGQTTLYSLAEFKPRKDKDVEKGYLSGQYGAIPFAGDPITLWVDQSNSDTADEEQEIEYNPVAEVAGR